MAQRNRYSALEVLEMFRNISDYHSESDSSGLSDIEGHSDTDSEYIFVEDPHVDCDSDSEYVLVEDQDVGDDCESLSDGSEESVSSVLPLPERRKGPSSQTNLDIAAFFGKDGTTWEKTAVLQGRAFTDNIVQQAQPVDVGPRYSVACQKPEG